MGRLLHDIDPTQSKSLGHAPVHNKNWYDLRRSRNPKIGQRRFTGQPRRGCCDSAFGHSRSPLPKFCGQGLTIAEQGFGA